MSKEIRLTRGRVAIVDDLDFKRLSAYKWMAKKSFNSVRVRWYATRNAPRDGGPRRDIKMHREIMSAAAGILIDHRDGDGLNNRRENLWTCSNADN